MPEIELPEHAGAVYTCPRCGAPFYHVGAFTYDRYSCQACLDEIAAEGSYDDDGSGSYRDDGNFYDDDNSDRNNVLFNYNTNVVKVLEPDVEIRIRNYGIEIEIQLDDYHEVDDFVTKLKSNSKLNGKWICKEDGSLDEEKGIEIVSIPMPYNELHESIAELFDIMRIRDCTIASTNCGTHIHVSRRAISGRTIGRFWALWYRAENNQEMRYLLRAFAGRFSTRYAQWFCEAPINMHMSKYAPSNGQPNINDHYAAVSCSRSHPTYETRMWAGACRKRTALKYLEALDMFLNICEETHGIEVLTNPDKFLIEVGKRLKQYPALLEVFTDFYNPNLPNPSGRTLLAQNYHKIKHLVEPKPSKKELSSEQLEKRRKRNERRQLTSRDVPVEKLSIINPKKQRKVTLKQGLEVLRYVEENIKERF